MNFDLQKVQESKHAFHRKLAARPIAEKLRLLDVLRERQLAIRGRAVVPSLSALHDPPSPYRSEPG